MPSNEHLFGLLQFYSSLMKEACMLQFLKSGYTPFMNLKVNEMSKFKLTSFNSTHLKIEKNFKQNMQPTFLVSYKSFINCVFMEHSNKKMDDINESKNAFNKTDQVTELMFGEEVQSLIYVIVILSVFTLIFAFILLLSYRYNELNAELQSSKIFVKKWFLKKDYQLCKEKVPENKKI